METLKEKTAKGLFWGGLSNLTQQALGLVFGILLARQLNAYDFGMTAMLVIFSVIANELQASGFKTGLINMKSPTHDDYNAVFWFNIVAGLVIYVVLFFSAPLIAAYYRIPELIPLARYVFLGFVFSSFGMAQSAYLTKNLQIKKIAWCGMTATLLSSLTGVCMAFLDFGYWSLATQSVLYIALNTMLLWRFSPWRPTLHFTFEPIRRLFPFSVRLMLSAILTQFNTYIMNILLGRYYGARSTGYYNQAFQWSSKCFQLVQSMMKQVDQPVLVGLQDERERQLNVLRKMMRFTAFVSFPLLLGLGLVSYEFIVIAIKIKWAASAELLPYLCLCGAFMPISGLLSDAIITHHRSDIYLWTTLALGACATVLLVLLKPYGIRNMVIAYAVLNIVWVFVWHFFVYRLMRYTLWAFLKDTMPFFTIAAGVMIVTGLATGWIVSLPLLLAARIVLACTLYYTVIKLLHVQILTDCLAFFSKFRNGRKGIS